MKLASAQQGRIYAQICDRKHPHYPKTGWLTGEIIDVLGTPMAKMELDHCKHGCFVKKGQVRQIPTADV